jgi:hypothetical protein
MSASEHEGGVVVHVADKDLAFRTVRLDDATPTGHQIAHAAGCRPAQDAVVLRMLEDGDVALVRPDEMVDLRHGGDHRFIVGIADHVSLLRIDGERLEWIGGIVSGAALRRLGRVPDDHEILLQRIDQPDREIAPTDLVNLDREGIEDFVTRKRAWKLNVHGVVVEFDVPRVKVRDALIKARFDSAKPWQIFLKVAGQPKREVQLDDVIDLTTPGIEKLRLMPRAVDNGEAPVAPRRLFGLLGEDVEYLDRLGLRWETVVEEGRRWLLVRDYPLPPGFTAAKSDIAFEIPPTYPQTQLYGFYFNPPLALASGRTIPSTQLSGVIDRRSFVGWSRYRPGQPWNPDADNVVTQFALAEACLLKEVGE